MPEQFCNRSQIRSGHNKSTGKGMAVAMPGIFLNLRLFERCREPSPRVLLRVTTTSRGEIRLRTRLRLVTLLFFEYRPVCGVGKITVRGVYPVGELNGGDGDGRRRGASEDKL